MTVQITMQPIRTRVYLGVFFVASVVSVALLTLGFQRTSPSSSFPPVPASLRTQANLLDSISNTTLGFQKIFVINLQSRSDHRDAISLAASLTGISVEYIDGVRDVDEKGLPPGGKELGLHKGGVGNWRAHMNAVRAVIEQNLTSALILEDDIDWDVRIKDQMKDFARATRLLVQPLPHSKNPDQFLDPTCPKPSDDQAPKDFDVDKESTRRPITSPYGDIDRWDLFWLGHCGAKFPSAKNKNVPLGRAVISNDETVPEPQHIKMQFGNSDLVKNYPAHTRVVSRAWSNTCTVGYAVSLAGAQRILYEMGLKKMDSTTDEMLRAVCDGAKGRTTPMTCLTVQPQLFQHHRPAGPMSSYSDITNHTDEGINEKAFTRNVRWSTRMNMPQLMAGSTDYFDQFKDGEEADSSLGW